MARSTTPVLTILELRQNIARLKKLGKDGGFTNSDIRRCIEEAIRRKDFQLKPSGKQHIDSSRTPFRNRRFKRTFKNVCKVTVLLVLIFAICLQFQAVERPILKCILCYMPSVMRFVRLSTLPLHDRSNISYYHDQICLWKNPYFQEPESECFACEYQKAVSVLNNSVHIGIEQLTSPILIKKHLPYGVSVNGILNVMEHYKDLIDVPNLHWESSAPWLTSPLSLLDSEVQEKMSDYHQFHLHWRSPSLAINSRLRQLFPRPSKLAKNLELSQEKTVFIDGPTARPYILEKAFAAFTVYMQGQKSSRIHLKPPQMCKESCLLHEVILEERDVLIFTSDVFRGEVFLLGDGIHVGFVTYIK